MMDISLDKACKYLKIEQIAQASQVFQLLNQATPVGWLVLACIRAKM